MNKFKPPDFRVLCGHAAFAICIAGGAWAFPVAAQQVQPPALMLADVYRESQHVDHWVMSEKLDGVRAYWDGKQLVSRQGNVFNPPSYFTRDFPPFPIDGELFSRRGEFERISAIVRSSEDKGWHLLKLHVFDVPQAAGDLSSRLGVLESYLRAHPAAPIEIVVQHPVKDKKHLREFLQTIEKLGGEGVIVRDPTAAYEVGRSPRLLKLKTTLDDECTVVAHHAGRGRHRGRLGALSCRNQYGVFKIGSGFSDADRENPPAVGSVITYRYRGFTNNQMPRFASFWRVRADAATSP